MVHVCTLQHNLERLHGSWPGWVTFPKVFESLFFNGASQLPNLNLSCLHANHAPQPYFPFTSKFCSFRPVYIVVWKKKHEASTGMLLPMAIFFLLRRDEPEGLVKDKRKHTCRFLMVIPDEF